MQSEGERSDELSDDMHVGWGAARLGVLSQSRVFLKKKEARRGDEAELRPQPCPLRLNNPPN
jgi:hypothetical protein